MNSIIAQPESEYPSPIAGIPRDCFVWWGTTQYLSFPWLRSDLQPLSDSPRNAIVVRPPKKEQWYVFTSDTASACNAD
jgi:hypothetical protein